MIRFAPRALLPFLLAVALIVSGFAAVRAQVFDSKDAGHAGLYRDDTVENANKLIERMQEDCHKTLIIETFLKPEWVDPQWPAKDAKNGNGARDPVHEVKVMYGRQREEYFLRWAQERAKFLNVDGVYVLICKTPKWVKAVVEPESNDNLFPEVRRVWLQDAIGRRLHNDRKDSDLLDEVIPGVWYTVQDLQRNPSQNGAGWSWLPVLAAIGVLLGSWVIIAVLRGVVALVRSFQPAQPELSKTQVVAQTTVPYPPVPPTNTNGGREDSVDY